MSVRNLCQPRIVILLEITPVKQSRHPHAIPHPLSPPAQGPKRKQDKQAKDRTQTSVSLIAVPYYVLYPYTFSRRTDRIIMSPSARVKDEYIYNVVTAARNTTPLNDFKS